MCHCGIVTHNVYNFISGQWMSSNEIYFPKISWILYVCVDGWLVFMVLRLFNENCALQLFYTCICSFNRMVTCGWSMKCESDSCCSMFSEIWFEIIFIYNGRYAIWKHFVAIFPFTLFFSSRRQSWQCEKKVRNLHLFRIISEALHWTFVPITIKHYNRIVIIAMRARKQIVNGFCLLCFGNSSDPTAFIVFAFFFV